MSKEKNRPKACLIKQGEPGRCPFCDKEFEEYGEQDLDGNSLAYRVKCPCGYEGWEVYAVDFSHYAYENGQPVREGDRLSADEVDCVNHPDNPPFSSDMED